MPRYKVLVVDDSAFMRKAVTVALEADSRFEVVGLARNGVEAVEKTKELNPDVITMDIDMPIMNGLEAIQRIMETHPTPILVLSSATEAGNATSIDALQRGAIDICHKEGLMEEEHHQQTLREKLLMVANTSVFKRKAISPVVPPSSCPKRQIGLVIIGSSTGGPSALSEIIEKLEADFPVPILIVQHMPNGFTGPLAEKFNTTCALTVQEVERGMVLEKGHVYIAPAGYQTTLREVDGRYVFSVTKDYSSDSLYKPSVDVSILSATDYFGDDLLVAILTGMGEDGLLGCREVKRKNGYVIAESEETAVVYGMPKMVVEAGLADVIAPIQHVYERIRRITY